MAALGPKMLNTANRKLAWVPTIADHHAPTATELAAGKDITLLVTAADYSLGATGDDSIEDPSLGSKSKASAPGLTTYEAAMNFFRFVNAADDTAWTTFTDKGIHGYLVERVGQIDDGQEQATVPFTAADEVSVYEVITNTPQKLSPSTAGYEKFRQVFSVQDLVDERAVVAAGA